MYCNNSVPAASFRIPRAACERDIALDPSHSNARLLALQRARARTLDPSHSKTTRALEPSHSHDERYLLASFFLLAFKFRVSCTVHVHVHVQCTGIYTHNVHTQHIAYTHIPHPGILSLVLVHEAVELDLWLEASLQRTVPENVSSTSPDFAILDKREVHVHMYTF